MQVNEQKTAAMAEEGAGANKESAVENAAKTVARTPRRNKKRWYTNLDLYLMLLLPVAYVLIFHYAPMYGVIIAFKDYSAGRGIWASPWVGFKHFAAFFEQPDFWVLVKNTLVVSIYSLILYTIVPIVFGLLLFEVPNKAAKRVVQTVTYAPYFISGVIVCSMCYSFLDADTGMLAQLFQALGAERTQYMYSTSAYYHVYVLSGLWQGLGWWSIIYVGTLSNVDPALHEAAIIDGANRFQRIIHINFPSILPVATIQFIMSVGNLMSIGFEKSWLLMNEQNKPAAKIIATYVYEISLKSTLKQFSMATAVGLFNSFINIILLIAANFLSKRVSETSLW